MVRTRAGKARVPVSIQQHDGTMNGRGQLDMDNDNWDDQENSWLDMEQLGGTELDRAAKQHATATHRGEMRRSGFALTTAHRLKRRDTGTYLHLLAVDNVGQRNAKWRLLMVESVSGTADD